MADLAGPVRPVIVITGEEETIEVVRVIRIDSQQFRGDVVAGPISRGIKRAERAQVQPHRRVGIRERDTRLGPMHTERRGVHYLPEPERSEQRIDAIPMTQQRGHAGVLVEVPHAGAHRQHRRPLPFARKRETPLQLPVEAHRIDAEDDALALRTGHVLLDGNDPGEMAAVLGAKTGLVYRQPVEGQRAEGAQMPPQADGVAHRHAVEQGQVFAAGAALDVEIGQRLLHGHAGKTARPARYVGGPSAVERFQLMARQRADPQLTRRQPLHQTVDDDGCHRKLFGTQGNLEPFRVAGPHPYTIDRRFIADVDHHDAMHTREHRGEAEEPGLVGRCAGRGVGEQHVGVGQRLTGDLIDDAARQVAITRRPFQALYQDVRPSRRAHVVEPRPGQHTLQQRLSREVAPRTIDVLAGHQVRVIHQVDLRQAGEFFERLIHRHTAQHQRVDAVRGGLSIGRAAPHQAAQANA